MKMNVTYMDALNRRESSDEERCARFILAHAILLSFPGVPAIYIQSILGSRNDYAGVEKLGYNRAINRKKYYSEEITTELNNKTTLRHAVYHELSRLIKIRRSHNEFHPDNDFTIDTVNSSVMCIQRSNADGNCLTGLFNVSENIQHINITDLHGRDLISEVDIVGNEITLRPWQVMWIK
ncbi:sucrose phosphorylase [Escherichia coli]|uniref:Sucrose phosphorylase n=1 Tax=Escherichia coli TaxID=562 RepID=A0A376LRH2_ECOLX|nr:sucrose phosphorylase [Escherichia coli]